MDSRNNSKIPSALRPDLQRDTELPNGYYSHPDVPNKIIRWVDHTRESINELPYVVRLFEDLENVYGIPTVHTQFIVSNPTNNEDIEGRYPDDVEVLMLSDRISNGATCDEALELATHDEQVADEFDELADKMLRHLGDTAKNGGAFMPDLYYIHQFMYDFDRPKGEHLVLVDTEPLFLSIEPHPKYRLAGSVPIQLLHSVRGVAEDIITIENASGRVSKARHRLQEVVSLFDAQGHEPVERMKLALLTAVEQNDKSYLEFLDDDGGFFNEELFKDVVESQMLLKTIQDEGIL